MGPAGRLFNIRQGDGKIEEYARHFLGVVRRSATEKTCLMVNFWGGLAEPFKSRMTYWVPDESLEDYINLAMNLCGLALRVELAVQPAPVQEPTESAPEPAPFREPTESAPEPALFREPMESAPEPAPFREPTESTPFREPTESASFREPTESTQETAHLNWWFSAPPWWHPALLAPPWPLALPAPPWHPVCLFLQALFHSTGPPLLPQIRLRPTPPPPPRICSVFVCGASGIRSLGGGGGGGGGEWCPAGVPWLATRCLCMLRTWLVCC